MNELQRLPENGVTWAPAQIDFSGYEDYEEAAKSIAEYINGIELTSDNVKDVKKILADARKVTDGLNRERINIKKAISTEYKLFEAKVNDLISIIDEADSKLRDKVREVEEAEREAKKEEVFREAGRAETGYPSRIQAVPDVRSPERRSVRFERGRHKSAF